MNNRIMMILLVLLSVAYFALRLMQDDSGSAKGGKPDVTVAFGNTASESVVDDVAGFSPARPEAAAPAVQSKPQAAQMSEPGGDEAVIEEPLANQEAPSLELADAENTESELPMLEMFFAEEAADPDWAPLFENQLRQDFSAVETEYSYLASAQCRSSMCRIVIDHASERAESEFLAQLPGLGRGKRGTVHRIYEGDSITTLLYIAREGISD